MKKWIMGFAFLAVSAGAILLTQGTTEASPQVISPLVKVLCRGNNACCQGTGPRNFIYKVVIPGGNVVKVSSLEVGTHDPDISHYVNQLLPAGWTLTIVPGSKRDRIACTSHGSTSFDTGNCPYKLVFSGPAQKKTFSLGYDFTLNWDHHDTAWKASNGNRANWSKPVGLGEGPLHSPLFP